MNNYDFDFSDANPSILTVRDMSGTGRTLFFDRTTDSPSTPDPEKNKFSLRDGSRSGTDLTQNAQFKDRIPAIRTLTIDMGSGDDTLIAYDGLLDDSPSLRFFGNDGNDSIRGSDRGDVLDGNAGNDTIFGSLGRDVIDGGLGNDLLRGGERPDVIEGAGGNDTIYGGSQADTLNGGNGRDLIYGDKGNDDISGGAAKDTLNGGGGSDRIFGGNDNDFLYAHHFDTVDEVVNGGQGNDRGYYSAAYGDPTNFEVIEEIIAGDY